MSCPLQTQSQFVKTISAFGPVAPGGVQCSCSSHHKDIKTPVAHQAQDSQVRWQRST